MPTPQQRKAAREIEDAIDREQWAKARVLIRAWLRRVPDDHWLLTRLALTYYENKQYKRALWYEQKALRIAPRCPLVMWDHAGTLDMLERTEDALSAYRAILKRGERNLAFGECGEGIAWARSLIADCYYRIGTIYERLGRRSRAIVAYREHLARRKKRTRSIYSLNEVKRRLKHLADGRTESARLR